LAKDEKITVSKESIKESKIEYGGLAEKKRYNYPNFD